MTTKIEWATKVWNPVRGCSKVSEGCRNCYAIRQARRFSGEGQPYEGLTENVGNSPNWTGEVRMVPEKLDEPLKWKKPERIFVNSMSDLFHESVPAYFIHDVFATMSIAKKHTFMILTKRPERMLNILKHFDVREHYSGTANCEWPLPNVWLGVSVENQKAADERIPYLLQTPATVRFLSCEPLLGPVDLKGWIYPGWDGDIRKAKPAPRVKWVIVGSESGPKRRHCDVEWVRSLRDQCTEARVPFFLKQLHIGKKVSQPELDGREWNEYPDIKRIKRRRYGTGRNASVTIPESVER